MVHNYKRKTQRQGWDGDHMRRALAAVVEGTPFKTAARQFSVPVMALKRRHKGKNTFAVSDVKTLGSKKCVFSEEQEEELVAHIVDMESRMYGLTNMDVRSLAYQLAEKNNISHSFCHETKLAGKDWLRGFRRRHPELSLRCPESTSAARARAFNRPVVNKFFSILREVNDTKQFPPHRIFNVDETSLSTVPGRNCKILARKGRKQVGRVVSAERGSSTTAVICMSAGGNFIPPMLIFNRKRMKQELQDGAPPGCVFACNDSGWMRLEVFSQWFGHFLSHVKPTEDDPALLILDGHLSHTKNLEVIDEARKNFVTILCLPPHCTHRLQPLDVGVMFPLSHYHDKALEKWMNNHHGRVVTFFQISQIFCESYLQACTPVNAINGFRKTGIVPLNPDVFTDIDFAAAETTENAAPDVPDEPDKPDECNESDKSDVLKGPVVPDQPTLPDETDVLDELYVPEEPRELGDRPNQNTVPKEQQENHEICEASCSKQHSSLSYYTYPGDGRSFQPHPPAAADDSSDDSLPQDHTLQDMSPSFSKFAVPPQAIKPTPKMSVKQRSVKKRKSQGTIVLTDSPYRNMLVENQRQKLERVDITAARRQKQNSVAAKKRPKPNECARTIRSMPNVGSKRNGQPHLLTSDSESEDDDEENKCMYCSEHFTNSVAGEQWVQCVVCRMWAHVACAGAEDDCGTYTCDLCNEKHKSATRNVRRKL